MSWGIIWTSSLSVANVSECGVFRPIRVLSSPQACLSSPDTSQIHNPDWGIGGKPSSSYIYVPGLTFSFPVKLNNGSIWVLFLALERYIFLFHSNTGRCLLNYMYSPNNLGYRVSHWNDSYSFQTLLTEQQRQTCYKVLFHWKFCWARLTTLNSGVKFPRTLESFWFTCIHFLLWDEHPWILKH